MHMTQALCNKAMTLYDIRYLKLFFVKYVVFKADLVVFLLFLLPDCLNLMIFPKEVKQKCAERVN